MTLDPATREREALEEIAATRVGGATARALVAFGLTLACAAIALEVIAAAQGRSRLFTPLPAAAALDEIERRFDQESALARALRPRGQWALTRLAGYGNEEAYVGRGGWLHFRTDFDHLTRRVPGPEFAGEPAVETMAFRDALAARGIALLILPVPVKLAIEPRRFVSDPSTAPLRPAAEAAHFAALADAGIETFDPTSRLTRMAAAGSGYLARDSHWRPEAMDEVARALAVELRALAELPAGAAERYAESTVEVGGTGDLDALLALPGSPAASPREKVGIRAVVDPAGAAWRPERGAPVLLLGDSFTAVFSQPDLGWGANAGLAERLSFHLGLPVDRIARNAGGAAATRRALTAELERDPTRLDGVRVVVWQFAAREITQGDWRVGPPTTPKEEQQR